MGKRRFQTGEPKGGFVAQSARLVKPSFAARTADELLRSPAGALAGVSPAAEAALASLDIRTIFDLASSRTFAAAARLVAAERDAGTADARLDAVPGDAIEAPAGIAARALARQAIGILRGIGPARAPQVAAALDAATVRDLALWPQFLAAKRILAEAFFPEQAGGDASAPADLRPAAGVYPTERVFYRRLLVDAAPTADAVLPPLEEAAAVDIVPGLLNPTGFDQPTTGALLTFSQSWFSQGLTLGQLLHSTSLAPGESTRIAMVDWTRRSRAATTEDIAETEQLANTQTHNRALSEVTSATATELQHGTSRTQANSTTGEAGLGIGLELGPIGLSASGGTTTTDAMTATSSFGVRNVAAEFAQDINDRSQQNASSARNRRASIVREVSQEEHETISTRVVTNYNHMHALTVQYYEVVQAFRVTTELARAERCLFVPLKLVDFTRLETVEQWRGPLIRAALTPAIARLLAELGTVKVTSKLPIRPFAGVASALTKPAVSSRPADPTAPAPATAAASAVAATADFAGHPEPAAASARAIGMASPLGRFIAGGWDANQLAHLAQATGRLRVSTRLSAIHISDDALVLGVTLREGRVLHMSVRRRDGSEVATRTTTATDVTFASGVPIAELQSIAVQHDGEQALATAAVLRFSLFGTISTLNVPIHLKPGGPSSPLQECVRFEGGGAARDLIDHLTANRLHYSQAIYRSLDGPAIASLLARFTFRGLPLAQLVDQQPVAVSANFLVFRSELPATGDATDPRLAADLTAWRAFLARTGLERPVPKSEIIPLPSGGVFAEAVLGRSNAAEPLELERFWNWQDSPIPLSAPEIAAVTAGSRSKIEALTPGQLSAPVVSIQSPVALPDPTGMAAVTAALQNANLFRDMSGLAQTAALAQAVQQVTAAGATTAMQQAGENLLTVMDQHTQRLRIAAALVAQLYGVPVSAKGGGAGAPGDATLTEQGGQVGEAKKLDAKHGAGAPGSAEADTLRNQVGAKGGELARKLVGAAGGNAGEAALITPAAGPTRGVGPKQPVPRTLTMRLHVSSHFASTEHFGPTPVQIDATLQDRDGTRIWERKGAAAPTVSGSLRTSEPTLFLNVWIDYELGWPQPTLVRTNRFAHMQIGSDATALQAAMTVMLDTKQVPMPAATTAPDDAAVEAAIKAAGISVYAVLGKPTVTPRSGGGFNVEVKVLNAIALYQQV